MINIKCEQLTGYILSEIFSGFNMKLYPYDGTTEPFDTFIARFENFSLHFQWSEPERLFNLLRSRYGTEYQSDRFRMELKSTKR